MAKQPDDEFDEIPELDDVVEPAGDSAEDDAASRPPPNYDLFGGEGVDLEALHEALMARLNDEVDIIVAELQVALESTVHRHFETRLRERLPGILDEVIGRNKDTDKPE